MGVGQSRTGAHSTASRRSFPSIFPFDAIIALFSFSGMANHTCDVPSVPPLDVHNEANFHLRTWDHQFGQCVCCDDRNSAAEFVRLYGKLPTLCSLIEVRFSAGLSIPDGCPITAFLCLDICTNCGNLLAGVQRD